MGTNVTDKNFEVLLNCEMVFLGVKPAFLSQAIDQCYGHPLSGKSLNKTVTIVSMLAGVSIHKLRQVSTI